MLSDSITAVWSFWRQDVRWRTEIQLPPTCLNTEKDINPPTCQETSLKCTHASDTRALCSNSCTVCVSPPSSSCHPLRHSSASHSHVLRGSCAPLSSRTPLGRIQNQTTQTVKCIRYQKQFSIHLWCLGNLHTTFSPTPASCMRFHVGNRHVQFDWIFLSVVSDPCGVMAHWL